MNLSPVAGRTRPRVWSILPTLALLVISGASGCDTEPTAPLDGENPQTAAPNPADPALTLDGVVITRGEIEAWLPYFSALDPTMGRNRCIRILLDLHLIPLAFARVEFAAEREVLAESAKALVRSLGQAGYDDTLEVVRKMPGLELLENVARQELPLPEQRWLFDDLNVGRISPVLETPQGFSVAAAKDKRHGVTKAYDRTDALVVRFFSHRAREHGAWREKLRDRLSNLAKEAKLVHPDFRDAVPPWLNR